MSENSQDQIEEAKDEASEGKKSEDALSADDKEEVQEEAVTLTATDDQATAI